MKNITEDKFCPKCRDTFPMLTFKAKKSPEAYEEFVYVYVNVDRYRCPNCNLLFEEGLIEVK